MLDRLRSFADRVDYLSAYSGGRLPAAAKVVQIYFDRFSLQKAKYNGTPFVFRGIDELALREVWAEDEYRFLEAALAKSTSPLVLDIGANVGTFALWTLDVNPNSIVVSVEANPETFDVLSENVVLSGCGDWHALNIAASAETGNRVKMAKGGLPLSSRVREDGELSVETISLGDLVERFAGKDKVVDVLKVDIEGSEEDFLANSSFDFSQVKEVVVELHPGYCDVDKVKDVLSSNYRIVDEISGRTSSKPLLYFRN